ncbi:MAG: hypothetical protein LBO66_12460 [Deltaproteobacteria bacterium]|jgi:hypothetical protein|nr:hypothetical protein [Deltaproteobacteria bacterium]
MSPRTERPDNSPKGRKEDPFLAEDNVSDAEERDSFEDSFPRFRDFFWRSWPILREKPARLLLAILALVIAKTLLGAVHDNLLATVWTGAGTANARWVGHGFVIVLPKSLQGVNVFNFILGYALPLLFVPLFASLFCRFALAGWDGHGARAGAVAAALKDYPRALALCARLATLFILYAAILAALFFPGYAAYSRPGFLPLPDLLKASVLLAAGFLIFLKFVWPRAKRLALLPALSLFALADRPSSETRPREEAQTLYRDLAFFPRAVNSLLAHAAFIVAALYLTIPPLTYFLREIADFPPLGRKILAETLILLTLYWLLLSVAGFYRIALRPVPPPPATRALTE